MPSRSIPSPTPTAGARRRRRGAAALGLSVLALASVACQPDTAVPAAPFVPADPSSVTVGAGHTPPSMPTMPTLPAEEVRVAAAQATLDGWSIGVVADAGGRSAVRYDWDGKATFTATLPYDSDSFTMSVKGDQCAGAPAYKVVVDGLEVATSTASSPTWVTETHARRLLAGTHTVTVEYTNDHWSLSCNRNLYVESVHFSAGPPAQAITGATIPATGFVRQSGTQLVDGAGQPLELRGVNLGGWLLWEGWMWGQGFDYVGQSSIMKNLGALVGPDQAKTFERQIFDNYITGDDFRAMSRYGINVARVPFNYRILEDDANPFVYKDSGWEVLDNVVALARAHNVYLVLDMHAAPCSQSLAFISDWNGGSYMWLSQKCQDRATALWKAIAARYANQNIIAGYDLLNETITGDQQLLGWYQRTTAAIREVDRNHVIIYEGNDLARKFDFLPTGLDSNMMISMHDYPWMIMGQDLSERMPTYIAAAERLGAPMWVGEFGQSSYEDIDRYVKAFDEAPNFVGFAQWAWKQVPGAPTMQNIQHTPASKKLIEWAMFPSRPKPTPEEAQQGMADFIEVIRFANTVPDARLEEILTGP